MMPKELTKSEWWKWVDRMKEMTVRASTRRPIVRTKAHRATGPDLDRFEDSTERESYSTDPSSCNAVCEAL